MPLRERVFNLIFETEESGSTGQVAKDTPPPRHEHSSESIIRSPPSSLAINSPPEGNADRADKSPGRKALFTAPLRRPVDPARPGPSRTNPCDPEFAWLDDDRTFDLIRKIQPGGLRIETGDTPGSQKPFPAPATRPESGEWSHLTSAADRVHYPVFAIDRARTVIAWNTAMETLTGISRKDMIGKGGHAYAIPFFGSGRPMLVDRAIIPPEIAMILEPVSSLWHGEVFVAGPHEAEIGDRTVFLRERAARIYDKEGRVIAAVESVGVTGPGCASGHPPEPVVCQAGEGLSRAIGKMNEIQDEILRNYAELARSRSQELNPETALSGETLLSDLIANACEGIFAYDTGLRCILWNRFMEELTGIPAGEVLGKPAAETFPVIRFSGGDNLSGRALAGETVESPDISLLSPRTGQQVWVRVAYSPLIDPWGRISGVIGIAHDTTSRKVMEYALQATIVQLTESELKYRNVFYAKNEPVFIVSAGSRTILDLNDAAERLYGWTRDEMLGTLFDNLAAGLEPGGHAPDHKLPGFRTECHRKKDGTVFSVDIASSPADVRGKSVEILFVRDTSGARQSAESLRFAIERLNLMIGITRHDVLNNLTVVMGYNTLVRQYTADSQVLGMLDKQEKVLASLQNMIEFTKEYDTIGVGSPAWQEVRKVASMAYGRFINTVAFSCQTGGLEIYADPMFDKVLYNLFDNAFRYGDGISRISIFCRREGSDLVLVFEDDGTGIPPQDKERIFNRGFGKHTGLGLFLSREILAVTRIGICETGEYRRGARFELRIPDGSFRFPGPGGPPEISLAVGCGTGSPDVSVRE